MNDPTTTVTDVAILGGGVAGLTLALQLIAATPELRVTIIERATFPVPEATHKVGESTVEIAAHYLRDVLGLSVHLFEEQLEKFGLRVFFTAGENTDITARPEIGHAIPPPQAVGTFQIDRGRLENYLMKRAAVSPSITVVDGSRVTGVEESPRGHYVTYQKDKTSYDLRARWLVDATGRASLLKRHMDLAKTVDHKSNAAWVRVHDEIDIDQWTDDPSWHQRIRKGQRRLSTNHLMGEGYWVWIIPLASGATSVGIVADDTVHDFNNFNSQERFLRWIGIHEPQLASVLTAGEHLIADFKVMRDYSYSAEKVFSADQGWFLTGEAGVFLDPFYSPGLDLIAISNGLISDIVTRAHAGQDVEELTAIHDQIFLIVSEGWLEIYRGHASTMASPCAMTAKVIWDTAVYWAVPGFLYFQDMISRVSDEPPVVIGLARFRAASLVVQQFFRDWAAVDDGDQGNPFVSFYDFSFMPELHTGMTAQLDESTATAQFMTNVALVEYLSGQMASSVLTRFESSGASPQQRAQAATWRADERLASLIKVYETNEFGLNVDAGWVWRQPTPAPAIGFEGGA